MRDVPVRLKITNLIEKEGNKVKYLPKYMQKKLVRKIAHQLWEFESDPTSTRDFEKYSVYLKKSLEKFLKQEMTKEQYISFLQMYTQLGYIPENLKLEIFLFKRLLCILISSIKQDRKDSTIDD